MNIEYALAIICSSTDKVGLPKFLAASGTFVVFSGTTDIMLDKIHQNNTINRHDDSM